MDEMLLTKIDRHVASGLITDRACLVFSACAIGTSAATNILNLFDGFSTSDRQVMTFAGIRYQPDFRNFNPPLFFGKGAYIEFATNGTEFFIQFAEIDE